MGGSPKLQEDGNMSLPHFQPVMNEVQERCATATTSSELDGDVSNDIAICGFSIKFPQEATSASAFWEMMMEKRCAMTEFPAERISLEGFHRKRNKLNTLPLRGGHFLKDDLSVFDADFFSISPAEAASMDPMQRWLLEAAYRALENAGIPMESVSGTATGVYTGSFSLDYMLQLTRDAESPPMYAAVGFGLSMLANRLSWFFNLRGPSIGLDSACSSTAAATDIACQALRNGSCSTALVAGSNLASAPEGYVWMSNANFLSPDSRCFSFDERANGYARGEGLAVMVLKKVSDAIRDGNTIRAVIRSTGSNEDGRTPGITQPSREAQERLIRETYMKAGLSMAQTRFFEAHGTGTPLGDPREAKAIGSAFREHRSDDEPLYVGAVKANIGHLEGASGLAGVIKTVLALEKGVIPPNTNFRRVNAKIDAQFLRLKFPEEGCPWPTSGLRRASINSFGYGGANSHIVVDDAYNYLRLRGLSGKHCTLPSPQSSSMSRSLVPQHRTEDKSLQLEQPPKVFVWSSADKEGIDRICQTYQDWWGREASNLSMHDGQEAFLADLSFTLAQHRSHLPWRSFAILRSPNQLEALHSHMSPAVKIPSRAPRLGFVFTGQGAQWYAMGRELLWYASFRAELYRAQRYLQSLGCPWLVIDELCKDESQSLLDDPEFSQPICTILQVALVNLLRTFKIWPAAVVGHSSGEIAAAYAAGSLTSESAWKLAYFRGLCSKELSIGHASQPRGAMLSVGLPEDRVTELLSKVNKSPLAYGISVACVNSPNNVTVSGEDDLINQLQVQLDEMSVFSRKLRVSVAYHSPQMETVSEKYMSLIGFLKAPVNVVNSSEIPMISSVTGEQIDTCRLLDPTYWVKNIISPVQFSQALLAMCAKDHTGLVKKIDRSHLSASVVDHLVEIGPHATLKGPIRETLSLSPRKIAIGYTCLLRRGVAATETILRAVGELYSIGVPLCLKTITAPTEERRSPKMLIHLPEYPFDHSQHYWHESRLSRNYRLRREAPSELLGVPSNDWVPSEARWRHFIRLAEMPWAEQHAINGTVLYPATGMLAMAVEAAKQLASRTPGRVIEGFTLRHVQFENAMSLNSDSQGLEVQTSLRQLTENNREGHTFEFIIRTFVHSEWMLNCRGLISVDVSTSSDAWQSERTAAQRMSLAKDLQGLLKSCGKPVISSSMYSYLRESGYDYGPLFQAAHNQHYDEKLQQATAEVSLFDLSEESHVFHPTSLDAILHLCFTAFTAGGTLPMATSIPSRINCMWISSEGLQSRENRRSVTTCATITNKTSRGFSCSGGALDSDDPRQLRLWYEGVELTSVSQTRPLAALPNPRQWCMNVECKVALGKLSNQEVASLLGDLHPAQKSDSEIFGDLELLIEMTLRNLRDTINPAQLPGGDLWKMKYWNWAERQLASLRQRRGLHEWPRPPSPPILQRSFHELVTRLENTNPVGRLYSRVASNLTALFTGDADPLELLVHSGLLKDYYQELAGYRHSRQVTTYLDLLAHQTPGMTILEVGGGTGAATRNFLKTLCSESTTRPASLRCERYDFTDISLSFTEKAREEFASFQAQMRFSTLDVEQDPAAQGFEASSYDIVVADNVLHATPDLATTLRNIRRALKPGGKLLMHEPLKPSGWTLGFVFGLFPAWWLGSNEDRLLSPSITSDAWNVLLKSNGFTGTDLTFRDFDDCEAHSLGWLVATATEEEPRPLNGTRNLLPVNARRHLFTVVIDGRSKDQKAISDQLVSQLRPVYQQVRILDLEASCLEPHNPDEIVIFLADFESNFLKSLDQDSWPRFKAFIKRSHSILWVSGSRVRDGSPDHGLLDGFARSLRTEYYEMHLVTLILDISRGKGDRLRLLVQVATEMATREPGQPYEQEYVEITGRLHTRRLVEAADLKSAMDKRLLSHEVVKTSLDGRSRLQVSRTFSQSDRHAPVFIPDQSGTGFEDGEEHSVDVLVRAVSLPPHQGSAILGQQGTTSSSGYNYYCAGTVVGISAGAGNSLQPGDRILAACSGPVRSHVRLPTQSTVKLTANLPFVDACTGTPILAAAHHLLSEISRLQQEDHVLVRQGATPIGQAALQVLSEHGVKGVWATVKDRNETALITKNLGIREDHILPESWFDSQPMMLSRWKHRFDFVLSLSSGSPAPQAMNYVRPGGRVILLHTGPTSRNDQYLHDAPRNMTVTTLHISEMSHIVTHRSLQYAVERGSLIPIDGTTLPVKVFPASKISTAFKHSVKTPTDAMVIEFDGTDTVDVTRVVKPTYSLSPDATYVIAGGLGGIGRAIVRWMVSRGARHLVLLSRSGPTSAAAQQLLSELSDNGVQVQTPLCDISDMPALRTVLGNCADALPPIKGCIQTSMVMRERIFEKMAFQDWKDPIDSKLHGSWNLHCQLPQGLDFFIMVSSMMSTIGGASLSSYSAGNSYMDALARYRVSKGERAAAIGLGPVPDGGWLTEHTERLAGMDGVEKYVTTVVKEVCALMEIYCDPNNSFSQSLTGCQPVLGIRPISHWSDIEEVPSTMLQPFWGHMHHVPLLSLEQLGSTGLEDQDANNKSVMLSRKRALNTAKRLAGAASLAEAAEIASEALAQRTLALLGTAEDRLDFQKPMHSYGIDSLSAIDIRNWVGKTFDVDLPVFEILGGATFTSAGLFIATKVQQKAQS